jgi:hypothetical protein
VAVVEHHDHREAAGDRLAKLVAVRQPGHRDLLAVDAQLEVGRLEVGDRGVGPVGDDGVEVNDSHVDRLAQHEALGLLGGSRRLAQRDGSQKGRGRGELARDEARSVHAAGKAPRPSTERASASLARLRAGAGGSWSYNPLETLEGRRTGDR